VSFSCLANTCNTGRLQSPINITSTQKQKLPALEFTYLTSPLVIANDGHTLRVRLNNQSQLKLGKQIYTFSGAFSYPSWRPNFR
jgi:carbonic anhydrase